MSVVVSLYTPLAYFLLLSLSFRGTHSHCLIPFFTATFSDSPHQCNFVGGRDEMCSRGGCNWFYSTSGDLAGRSPESPVLSTGNGYSITERLTSSGKEPLLNIPTFDMDNFLKLLTGTRVKLYT